MTPAETDAPGAAPDIPGTGPEGPSATRDELRATILSLATARGPEKTICPSEAARALAGTNEKAWRRLMKPIRTEAVRLADDGLVEIRRKGWPVNPREVRGIYRIAIR